MTFDTTVQRSDSPSGVLGGETVNDQLQRSSFVPFYALIVLVGAASGLLYLQKPLKSARPSTSEELKSSKAMTTIDARLWQDPLLAVEHHRESIESDNFGQEPAEFQEFAKGTKPELVIPIAIPGGFGVEDHETRLRSRYAVISALDFAGYSPSENGELGVVKFADPSENGVEPCIDNKGQPFWVPYEWVEPNVLRSQLPIVAGADPATGPRFRKILVLWIPDGVLSKTPIKSLLCVLTRMLPSSEKNIPIRFLGPTSSDGHLEIMAENAKETPADFKVLSSWATASDFLLQLTPDSTGNKTDKVILPDWYTRVIGRDGLLVQDLLAELKSREIRPTQDQIALISEWDTFYGRALPLTFAAHLRAWEGSESEPRPPDASDEDYRAILENEPKEWPDNIMRAAYLQGLDGQVAGWKPLTASVKPDVSTGRGTARTDFQALERPEGRSQLDYARRLALDLERRGGRGLRAVGILGSDVYDKLLLIQALRELFPHAIFFTTDLDERLTHPSQTRWTRNLVIASSFGPRLTVDEGLPEEWGPRQLQTPPFRDCYQTSLYRATLLALGVLRENRLPTKAKVFEVGRTRIYQLAEGPPERERVRNFRCWWPCSPGSCSSGCCAT